MKHEQHCQQSLLLFGEPFHDVHHWLDELAGKGPWGMAHRCFRHNLEGIEYVRARWGDKAAEAARQHIIQDLNMEGWTISDDFPKNAEHYKKIRFSAVYNGKPGQKGFEF